MRLAVSAISIPAVCSKGLGSSSRRRRPASMPRTNPIATVACVRMAGVGIVRCTILGQKGRLTGGAYHLGGICTIIVMHHNGTTADAGIPWAPLVRSRGRIAMTDLSVAKKLSPYKPKNKVRFVTAASLFDGHDASINIMRRILQSTGSEVIHLGHNRSVQEIVNAALQEDVHGIAITSYQGGHVEFFKYMIDLLKANGGENTKIFGGGGGVIVPAEIKELHAYGVTRIYAPEDGVHMGLQGMINEVVQNADYDVADQGVPTPEQALAGLKAAAELATPVLGITGTGGAGKSSLTDELVRRFRLDQNDSVKIGLVSIDPSRKRTGGALLGDRIRMNAIEHPNIFMRSLATRDTGSEISVALPEVIAACKLAGFDLVIVETSGIGQGNAAIVPFVDLSLYVMTPEFGAASQLEKIDMLDFADFVAINKFDRKGAEDALRDVRKQVQRNRELFTQSPDEMPA